MPSEDVPTHKEPSLGLIAETCTCELPTSEADAVHTACTPRARTSTNRMTSFQFKIISLLKQRYKYNNYLWCYCYCVSKILNFQKQSKVSGLVGSSPQGADIVKEDCVNLIPGILDGIPTFDGGRF